MAGFAALHVSNMFFGMAYGIAFLFVISHILPQKEYAEIVFLTIVGLYLQPFDQAIGRAGFVALRAELERSGTLRASRGFVAASMIQAAGTLAAMAIIPSFLADIGSVRWFTYVMYLAVCRGTSLWFFGLQSTAWAMDYSERFVRFSTAFRVLNALALLLAYMTKSFLLFTVVALGACVVTSWIMFRIFARRGLFAGPPLKADLYDYASSFLTSLMTSGTDFLVVSAPYALISMNYGIGSTLVIFDSVMKVTRVSMAGSRTLSEIALPRYAKALLQRHDKDALNLFCIVVAICICATSIPSFLIAAFGHDVFRVMLGPNDVVPQGAMAPAAIIILASGLYQPSTFFLGHSDQARPAKILGLSAVAGIAFYGLLVALFPMDAIGALWLFATYVVVLGAVAFHLGLRLHGSVHAADADLRLIGDEGI